MMICGNTGVIVGSEWCGLCRVHGCEGYKSYKQKCKNKKQGKIMVFEDWFEEELKCKHEECPYKACQWHRYCLEEQDRDDYARKYYVARFFPLNFEDTKECTLYLDQ